VVERRKSLLLTSQETLPGNIKPFPLFRETASYLAVTESFCINNSLTG
jgi:hypothetical protein